MNMNNINLHNEFEFILEDTQTKKAKKGHAYNLITNTGLENARGGVPITYYMLLGKGEGTPSVEDVQLFDFVGAMATTLVSNKYDEKTGVFTSRYKVTLDETKYNGTLFTEVGLSHNDLGNQKALCTHAMIVDEHGKPMSIEKTATTILTIYATVYLQLKVDNTAYFDPFNSTFALVSNILGSVGRGSLHGYLLPNRYLGGLIPRLKNIPITNTPEGPKTQFSILGAESNGELYRYIGYGRIADNRFNQPMGIAYEAGEIAGFPRTLRTDDIIGEGDGETRTFAAKSKYPVIKNEKVQVKVDDEVKEAEIKTFTSWDCKELLSGHYQKVKDVIYRSTWTDGYTTKTYLYKCQEDQLTEDQELVAFGSFSTNLSYGSARIVPTAYTESHGKVIVSVSGQSSYGGIFEGTIDPKTKEVTLGTQLISSPDVSCIINQEGTILCTRANVLAIYEDKTVLLFPIGGSAKLGMVDNLVYNVANGKAYKIDKSTGEYKAHELEGQGIRTGVGPTSWYTLKKVRENIYAVIGLTSKPDDSTSTRPIVPEVAGAIIDVATGKVSTDTFRLLNTAHLTWINYSEYLGPLVINYDRILDVDVDIDNKTLYVYTCHAASENIIAGRGVYMLSDTVGIYTGTNTSCVVKKSKEFVREITFPEAPAIGTKIKLTGELDGFLKTKDYKISFEALYKINANNS